MITELFTRIFPEKKNPITQQDWEQTRSERFVDAALADQQALEALVRRVHWISAVCFMEQVKPESLRLAPAFLEHVIEELDELSEFDAFALYTEFLARFGESREIGDA